MTNVNCEGDAYLHEVSCGLVGIRFKSFVAKLTYCVHPHYDDLRRQLLHAAITTKMISVFRLDTKCDIHTMKINGEHQDVVAVMNMMIAADNHISQRYSSRWIKCSDSYLP